MSRHPWVPRPLILFMLAAGPLACASTRGGLDEHPTIETFGDGTAIEYYGTRLGRMMGLNTDGAVRPSFWALRIPEDFVRDAIGPGGVDTCLKNVQAGGFSCKTQLSDTVGFRMALNEGEVTWWMEVDAAKPPFPLHKWHYGADAPGAINGWETR